MISGIIGPVTRSTGFAIVSSSRSFLFMALLVAPGRDGRQSKETGDRIYDLRGHCWQWRRLNTTFRRSPLVFRL
jgi:hypothetical protein